MSDVTRVRAPEELGPVECWYLLGSTEVGRLAVAIRNRPDIFPVNYAVKDETIIINTAPGTKLAAAVLGRAVAFESDVIDPGTRTAWSVVVRGHAEEITDLEELVEMDELGIEPWTPTTKTRYLRIVPEVVTGRRI
ncbi:MAG: pyridoxamine 5'-phosphate oxidase family protein [Actinomycetota bacterium]